MISGGKLFRTIAVITLLLLVAFSFTFISMDAEEEVDLYITPETEHLPVGHLLSYLLETEFGLQVHEKIQYPEVGLRKVVNQEGDLFIGLNLPPAREVAWTYSLNQLCNLGPVYEDVIMGWAVPNYVGEGTLGSLVDLDKPEVKTRLHREIVTFESRDNLVELSRNVIENNEYLKEYKLVILREMVASSELDRATRNREWIVMTMKRPSVSYSIHDLRFIEELTDEQSVHLIGRSDLMATFSNRVTKFLSRFYLPIDLVNELVRMYDKDQDSAVRDFVENHERLVRYWVDGVESL